MERTVRVREGETLVLTLGNFDVELTRVDDSRVRVRALEDVPMFVRRRAPRSARVGAVRGSLGE